MVMKSAAPPRIDCPLCKRSGRDSYGVCPLCNGELTVQPFTMSRPCKFPACAGNVAAFIRKSGPNNSARCVRCYQFQYCPSKEETGEERRSVKSRPGLKEGQRARILQRDGGACLLCKRSDVILHVAHALSIAEIREHGIVDIEENDDFNLFASCEECNLDLGKNSVEARIFLYLIAVRLKRGRQ
jgi:hypothetical protein